MAGKFSGRSMKAKIARLQEGLAQAQTFARAVEDDDGQTDPAPVATSSVVKALQEENLRLAARQEIAERTAAENSDALHSRLGEVQNERDEVRRQLEQVQDERRRERLEHEATLCRAPDQALAGLAGPARGTAARQDA